MIEVSVIMPVYNAEIYLPDAIDSVLGQTFKNFELIIVDDGSTDQSGKICDEYAMKNKCIHVFHKKNGGICDARNFGMKQAKGEYVAFIDNDDEYSEKLLEDNIKLAQKYNADVIRFERKKINIDQKGNKSIEHRVGLNSIVKENKYYTVMDKNEVFNNYLLIKRGGGLSNVWNGLYKKSFLEKYNIIFNTEYKYGCEDILFNINVYDYAKKYVFNRQEYYIYNWRANVSTSAIFREERIYNIAETSLIELEILEKNSHKNINKSLICIDYVYQFCQELNFSSCTLNKYEKRKFFNELYKKYKKFLTIKILIKIARFRIKDAAFAILFKLKLYDLLLYVQKVYAEN